jgi:hypothetical protein
MRHEFLGEELLVDVVVDRQKSPWGDAYPGAIVPVTEDVRGVQTRHQPVVLTKWGTAGVVLTQAMSDFRHEYALQIEIVDLGPREGPQGVGG